MVSSTLWPAACCVHFWPATWTMNYYDSIPFDWPTTITMNYYDSIFFDWPATLTVNLLRFNPFWLTGDPGKNWLRSGLFVVVEMKPQLVVKEPRMKEKMLNENAWWKAERAREGRDEDGILNRYYDLSKKNCPSCLPEYLRFSASIWAKFVRFVNSWKLSIQPCSPYLSIFIRLEMRAF